MPESSLLKESRITAVCHGVPPAAPESLGCGTPFSCFACGLVFLALMVVRTAGAQSAPELACTQVQTPSRFDERMVGLDDAITYAGPHEALYEELLARSRSIVRIKDVRDNASGSSLRFAQLTGVLFGSKCHVVTNRHGVSVIAKERSGGYRLQDSPVVHVQRRPVLDLSKSPVGKVTATVEFGRASGRVVSVPAQVIHAESMQSEDEVDGDLAVLRLDAPLPQAQLATFVPIDALRRPASCTFPAATLGYPILPPRGRVPIVANRTELEIRGLSGELLVADLSCGLRSCVAGNEACDDAIIKRGGFKRALVSTCISAEGASGSPLYVLAERDRPLVAGLITKTVSRSDPDATESTWGIAVARGFTQVELERLQAVIKADIRDAGLVGCD